MIAANNFTGLKDAVQEANNVKLDNLIAAAEDVRHDEFYTGQTWTEGSLAYDLGTDKYRKPGFNIFTGESALLDKNVSMFSKVKLSFCSNNVNILSTYFFAFLFNKDVNHCNLNSL